MDNYLAQRRKTLEKHAKTQEAMDRLVVKKDASTIKNTNVVNSQKGRDSYRLKMLELASHSQADKFITQLALDNVTAEVNRTGEKIRNSYWTF